MSEHYKQEQNEKQLRLAARKKRNYAIAFLLFAFIAVVYVMGYVRMSLLWG